MQIIWLSVWSSVWSIARCVRLVPDRTGASLHFYAAAAAAKGRFNTIGAAAAASDMSVFPTEAAVEIKIR